MPVMTEHGLQYIPMSMGQDATADLYGGMSYAGYGAGYPGSWWGGGAELGDDGFGMPMFKGGKGAGRKSKGGSYMTGAHQMEPANIVGMESMGDGEEDEED